MENTIKITAEVLQHDANSCKFTIDRSIFDGEFARFATKESAEGSPLAQMLFAVPGITRVDISNFTVTLTKSTDQDWRTLGPQIGKALRAHIASGQPAVNPEVQEKRPVEDQIRLKVQKILDEQINPAVASHGGMISLLDVMGNTVFIKMGGGCQGCGQANVTLKDGVVRAIQEQVPEVAEVLDSTDHAGGANPYYTPMH